MLKTMQWPLVLAFFLIGTSLHGLTQTTNGQVGYEEIEVIDGGSLSGVVRLSGEPPAIESLKVSADEEFCGTTISSPIYQFSEDGGLRYAVVSIEDIHRGKAIENGGISIANEKCMFVPYVQAATVGSSLEVVNNDSIIHTTHASVNRRLGFNVALPIKGFRVTKQLRRPGVVKIKCDTHEWMRAWILVKKHPYFAVTGENGRFSLTDIPAGTYKLQAWHEAFGLIAQEVQISAGDRQEVEFTFEREEQH